MQGCYADGFRVIYLDEMMVATSRIPTHEYSRKNSSIQIDRKQYSHKSIAVLAGISASCGLDLMMTFDRSVDVRKFLVFLDALRRKFFFDDLCIYLDNLSVHRSNAVKKRLEELSIKCVFNPVYSPDYNPIENIFSNASRFIKRRRLEAVMNG